MLEGWARGGETVENFAVVGGLIGMQVLGACGTVVISLLMSFQINPLSLVAFTALSTFFILSPLCFFFERSIWPRTFSIKLVIRFMFIAFIGVTLFQVLYLNGIKLTSPEMATAMPNLAPGLIFIIAWIFRLERVRLGCLYSKVKIAGTVLCVIGAIAMSLAQSGGPKEAGELVTSIPPLVFDKDKIIGSMYLIGAVLALSSSIVLQATTLAEFPAPMTLSAITSLIGAFITALVQFIQDQNMDCDWSAVSAQDLFCFSLLAGAVNSAATSFNNWALKKKGPVLVSMFNPISTVCSVILSVSTLGGTFTLGSCVSIFVVFAGLYLVLWAKGKEGSTVVVDDALESGYDAEKPLLS